MVVVSSIIRTEVFQWELCCSIIIIILLYKVCKDKERGEYELELEEIVSNPETVNQGPLTIEGMNYNELNSDELNELKGDSYQCKGTLV